MQKKIETLLEDFIELPPETQSSTYMHQKIPRIRFALFAFVRGCGLLASELSS